MGRAPCCEKVGLKRGRWTAEEDELLTKYIQTNGEGHWRSLPKNAGLLRCGKSCRLRWVNYLKADLKRGNFSTDEENIIINLHAAVGNRWSLIAGYLPGRTDNEIKNYWNSHLRRKIDTFRRASNSVPIPIIMDLTQKKKIPPTNKREDKASRGTMKKSKTTDPSTKTKEASSHDNNILTGEGILINNKKEKSMLLDAYVNDKDNKKHEIVPTCQGHGLFGMLDDDGVSSENNNYILGFEKGNNIGGQCGGINDDDMGTLSFPDITDNELLDEDWPPTSSAYIGNNNPIMVSSNSATSGEEIGQRTVDSEDNMAISMSKLPEKVGVMDEATFPTEVNENNIEDVICNDIASPNGESGEWNSCLSISSKRLDEMGLNWDWEDVAQGNNNLEFDDDDGYPFRCLWESEDLICEGHNFDEATYGENQQALVSWLLS